MSVPPGSPPQPVKPTLRGAAIVIAITVLIPSCFLLLEMASYQFARLDCQDLLNNGRKVSAIVTYLECVDCSSDSRINWVYYSFPASVDGKLTTINGRKDVEYRFFSSLKVGQTIEMTYENSNPYQSVLPGEIGCRDAPYIVPPLMVGLILDFVFLWCVGIILGISFRRKK